MLELPIIIIKTVLGRLYRFLSFSIAVTHTLSLPFRERQMLFFSDVHQVLVVFQSKLNKVSDPRLHVAV